MMKFERKERLSDSFAIRRALKQGRRYHALDFNIYILENGLNFSRLCSKVQKRRFKKAVLRNRIRRLHRELFRRFKPEFKRPIDIVIEARICHKDIKFKELEGKFSMVLKRAGVLK